MSAGIHNTNGLRSTKARLASAAGALALVGTVVFAAAPGAADAQGYNLYASPQHSLRAGAVQPAPQFHHAPRPVRVATAQRAAPAYFAPTAYRAQPTHYAQAPVRQAPAYRAAPTYGANPYPAPVYGQPARVRERPDNNLVKVGIARFAPQVSSGELNGLDDDLANALTPADYRVDVKSTNTVAATYTRFFGDHFGIEIPLGLPVEFDLAGDGAAGFVENVGTVKALPATVIGEFYFTPREAAFRPYVGVGINRTFFSGEEADADLEAAVLGTTMVDIKDSTGLGVFAGANLRLSDSVHASLLAGYVDVDTTATLETNTLDFLPVTREIDVEIDPIVGLATIGFSF